MKYFWRSIASICFLFSFATIHGESDDPLLEAMLDELDRSMNELRLEESEGPYFVSYQVNEVDGITASASQGAVVIRNESRFRNAYVDVRVGDYAFDNTNWRSQSSGFGPTARGAPLPKDDDYDEIRRVLWRLTDSAYKDALKSLTSKTAALENRTQVREVPDFSKEEPLEYRKVEDYDPPDFDAIKQTIEKLSSAFVDQPHIFSSLVEVNAASGRRTFVNSEGTTLQQSTQICFLRVTATSQAESGRETIDFDFEHAESCDELPIESLEARVQALVQRMQEQLNAEELATYDGPVLFEGQAAAELLSQGLTPRLIATRVPTTDNQAMSSQLMRSRNPFLDKIGARVLTRSLSLVNDPTLEEYDGKSLAGSLEVDADGVPAQQVSLIERGILKSLLTTRTPVDDFVQSTGSNRGIGAMPSNLIFETRGGISPEELREELLSVAAERGLDYGIVVRRLSNMIGISVGISGRPIGMFNAMSMMTGSLSVSPVIEAYKVYADGREVPIASVTISNFSDRVFREILEVSEEVSRHDVVFVPSAIGMIGANNIAFVATTPPLVSMVVPSLLFEELTLKQASEMYPQRPVVSHPLAQ